MRQRQGMCTRCKIAWGWTLNVRLCDQVCACCAGPLARVNRRLTDQGDYTWMTWEEYRR